MVVDKQTNLVICISFSNGKRHDFCLLKESKARIHPAVNVLVDTGYQGIAKIHKQSELPKKKSKENPLTEEDKKANKIISGKRSANENTIEMLKHFKILSDRYRNRRRRFCLRFNLITVICNWEFKS